MNESEVDVLSASGQRKQAKVTDAYRVGVRTIDCNGLVDLFHVDAFHVSAVDHLWIPSVPLVAVHSLVKSPFRPRRLAEQHPQNLCVRVREGAFNSLIDDV